MNRTPRMTARPGSSSFVVAALTGAILLLPLEALAQACIGSPNTPGQFSVTGDANVTRNTTDFGGGVQWNMPGPLALQAGAHVRERDDGDRRTTRLNGKLAYDLGITALSVCPTVGAEYQTHSDETNGRQSDSALLLPVALAVGGRLNLNGGPTVIPSAEAGVSYRRFSSGVDELVETDTNLFAVAGATVALDEVFFRGEVGVDSDGDTDPWFAFRVGVRF